MPKITEIFLFETPSQNAAAVQAVIPVTEIPSFLISGMEKLEKFMIESKLIPCDAPFVKIVPESENELSITAGIAVAKSFEPKDGISCVEIPDGKKLICYYQGNNAEMGPTYDEIFAFAQQRGLKPGKDIFEYYLNGTDFGVEKLLTKIVLPVD